MTKEIEDIGDYSRAVSLDSNGNPLKIEHFKGGSYNTETGEYTGGVLLYTELLRFDENGNWLGTYRQ